MQNYLCLYQNSFVDKKVDENIRLFATNFITEGFGVLSAYMLTGFFLFIIVPPLFKKSSTATSP